MLPCSGHPLRLNGFLKPGIIFRRNVCNRVVFIFVLFPIKYQFSSFSCTVEEMAFRDGERIQSYVLDVKNKHLTHCDVKVSGSCRKPV